MGKKEMQKVANEFKKKARQFVIERGWKCDKDYGFNRNEETEIQMDLSDVLDSEGIDFQLEDW